MKRRIKRRAENRDNSYRSSIPFTGFLKTISEKIPGNKSKDLGVYYR